MTDPRTLLHAAHAKRASAQERLDAALAALGRAKTLLEGEEAALERFKESDAAEERSRVRRLVDFLRAGGDTPDDAPQPAASHERQRAQARYDAVRAAHDAIAVEVEQERATVDKASGVVQSCALDVLRSEALALGRQLQALESTRIALRFKLLGLALLWVSPDGQRPIAFPMPALALDALHYREPQRAGGGSFDNDELKRWAAYLAALQTNPDAEFEQCASVGLDVS